MASTEVIHKQFRTVGETNQEELVTWVGTPKKLKHGFTGSFHLSVHAAAGIELNPKEIGASSEEK